MKQVKPSVSIIIPCFNRAHIVDKAISSVQAQSFSDWELIIVDDGSSDDLPATLRAYASDLRIRVIRHPHNSGEPVARNTGIAAASGRFIAFLDSDDTWMPEKLSRQISAVLSMPKPDNVFCVTQTVVRLSKHRQIIRPLQGPAPGRSFAEFLYNDGGFAQSSSFFLSKQLAQKFPFRKSLTQMVDHLFFIEVGVAGADYLLVPEPLTVWDNEALPDRISLSQGLDKWRATVRHFREEAAPLLPPHVLMACEARFLSGVLWKKSPTESLKLLMRAHQCGALSTRQTAMLFCRNALPPRIYNLARDWLSRVQSKRRYDLA